MCASQLNGRYEWYGTAVVVLAAPGFPQGAVQPQSFNNITTTTSLTHMAPVGLALAGLQLWGVNPTVNRWKSLEASGSHTPARVLMVQ